MKNILRDIAIIIRLILLFVSLDAFAEKATDAATGNKLDLSKGREIYATSCSECHDTGKNGAPVLKDTEAWKTRSFEWFSVLKQHASNGLLKMPPKGQHFEITDQEIADAVFFMTEEINRKK